MRLLFIVQQFRQGWGGAPESVRLMANQLQDAGVVSDVFDNGRCHHDIGTLQLLPEPGCAALDFDAAQVGNYDALIIAGPWQKPGAIRRLLACRMPHQKLFYLPRGGLARAEFQRPRDIKKFPYFYGIERAFLKAADGIVFSSEAEARHTMPFAQGLAPSHIIPDFVNPVERPAASGDASSGPVTLSFLAEISPRKGLLPLVKGFTEWSRKTGSRDKARLVVGGAVRPGSERYLATARSIAEANADAADIEFLGAVPHGERDSFYAGTDLMVVSSSFESYGLTVIEALGQGCALLCCPSVGALEYLASGQPVTIAKGHDACAIESALAHSPFVQRRAESRRAEDRITAAAAVDAINARASALWEKILHA